MEILFVIAIVVGITGGIVATRRGRSGFGWFLLCFLLPIAIIILLALPAIKESDGEEEEEVKKCPDCAELIRVEARKCRYCGYDFTAPKQQPRSGGKEPTFGDRLGLGH